MINSLSKDSHITHTKRAQISYSTKSKTQTGYAVAPAQDKFNKNVNVPATISFSGLFSPKKVENLFCAKNLENLKVIETLEDLTEVESFPFRKLFESARNFLAPAEKESVIDKKALHKSTKDLIDGAVDFIQNPEQKADESVQKFLETDSNAQNIKTYLDDVKKLIKHKDADGVIDHESSEYKDAVKKAVGESVEILNSTDNPGKLFTNKTVKKLLEKAEKNQLIFSAMYSLLLAGFLRPATIVSLPGKKNKEDKKYAAAHSISSGVMGYLEALVVATPIALAIKKIAKDPKKYLNKDTIDFIENKKPSTESVGKVGRRIAKEAVEMGETKRFGIARKYLNMGPGTLTSIPQAIITIALIPFVLKYVFGLDKKSHAVSKTVPVLENHALMGFKGSKAPTRKVFQNFMGDSK